jgi:hypothetical protein
MIIVKYHKAMELQNRILVAFNKFYSNFIKDIKASDEEIRSVIKKNYKVIDKLSEDYVEYFKSQVKDLVSVIVEQDKEVLSMNESFLRSKLAKDVTVAQVLKAITNDQDRQVFWNYVFILTTLMLVKNAYDEEEDNEQVELLFSSVITILAKIQGHDDGVSSLIADIMDDDIRTLLGKIRDFKTKVKMEDDAPSGFGNMLKDSMIANLAKEISDEIDVGNLNVEKPEDVLKLMDFSSSNNVVGDIIKKVSSKIHDKISTGELKQEELFGEAMNMMNMMNMGGSGLGNMFNNPMVSELMKSMKKGKTNFRQDVVNKASARDRLRAKLEERKKEKNVS